MVEIGILILAAGKSSRMRGDDKLTQKIDGVEQIKRIAHSACATGASVAVTLPDAAHPRASYLLDLDLQVISVPEAYLGMGGSISAGISLLAALDLDGVMIVPADMPEITQCLYYCDTMFIQKKLFMFHFNILEFTSMFSEIVFPPQDTLWWVVKDE